MRILKVLFLVAFLSGCAGTTVVEPRTFDLGLEAPAALPAQIRIGAVRATAPFDATDMQYRLAYRNAAEVAAFANSRWAATPAEMVRKQLLRAAGEGAGRCSLEVEIHEFSQVFNAAEASDARIELRASLRGGASRSLSVIEPNAGSDAVSGAAALARAANRAIGDIGRWAAAQPDCR